MKHFVGFISICLTLVAGGAVADAQLIKVTVGNNAISGNGLPAFVAKEAGLFRSNGLDVQIVYFRGGTITAMAMVARETPISQVSGPPIVSAALKGADTVMVAGGNVVSEYWIMSRPEIRTAEQLKGGQIAVATFGGQAELISRIALRRLGLIPGKDVAIVQIGTVPERLSALDKGRVQGAMLNPPDNVVAQKRGFYPLIGVKLPYQGVGVGTTRTVIRENPEIVRRYVKAQIEAIHRIKIDRELTIKVLAKYLASSNREILEQTYDDLASDEKLAPKQYPTLEGIKNILDPMAENDPKAKTAKPEDFVDMRFVKELDESGFIDELYKSRKR